MSAPRTGTCAPWATTADLCSPCTPETADIATMLQAASDVLFELSGRRFSGECSATVRPNARWRVDDPVHENLIGWGGQGFTGTGGWWNSWGGGCGCQQGRGEATFGCDTVSEITLGGSPVVSITAVKVDGIALAASRYRIDDNRYLVRLPDADGSNPGWPCCQDMTLDDAQVGTWSVAYKYGVAPPPMGVQAAAVLACELAQMCVGGACALPARVTSMTRQGVSVNTMDPQDFLDHGRTGLYVVDLFLKAYNPDGLRRPATVWSPDVPRRVRRAGT